MALSFPKGQALNSNFSSNVYWGTEFVLTLPTIDDIINNILATSRGALLYKVDIARAFRQIKIDPADYKFLGLYHEGYYLEV